ncbi:MAG: isoleucine--tRNA ligase [Candidatus Caldarchaeum sp.]|nr:isoleucine--tRNA ligase [Candidatus Caldarchaeum sp.]MCX8200747.1 isoleucine--tRNA ligase [Candidatus Caldarchaeum sp.]MDW8434656.1 isoleucine--tRNA ligase [Candidatus Caldarchaeum sp.]
MESAASRRYNPRLVEEQVSRYWAQNNIIRKVLEANPDGPLFSFLEGPPTVNGYMHIGHTRGRVYKDIVLRYKTMNGFRVWRRAGWDCQGLPTEIEVEKKLGITSKRDIEKIGMEKFVQEAWNVVDHYLSHWRKASERLGLWLDYDTAYETRKDEYMEHVWHLLKQAHQNGDLVESLRVVPSCPQCETALSQHELAQGYDEVVDPSIYVKMPLTEGGYVIIWTTTPWTLPGNEAVAVKPDAKYVEIQYDGERWFVAEQLLPKFVDETKIAGFKVNRTVDGGYFIGKRYRHPLLEEVPNHLNEEHYIVPSEHVTLEEGTGFVHIAPAHGPEDFEIGQRHGLNIFCPVNPSGYFTAQGGRYAGLKVWDASEKIIEDLEAKHLLVKKLEILHSYPHCWRCGSKLIYLTSVQWFLKVERIKERMVEENKSVKWWPEWAGSNRFGDWLVNAQDWCISRSKIWGTPLNVWRCESCGEKTVVGSRAELEEAVEKPSVKRMHRPWVDAYVFRCPSCGGMMKRIPFVLDTWLDSGVAFYASVDALRQQQLFNQVYPYDFITEAIDQTRGWFYTLLFTSTLLMGKTPFKSVLNQGHVLDEFGKKMSKSRGNVVWAEDAFDRYGVDPIRIYLVSKAEPWSTINFVPSEVEETIEDLNILWNVFQFASTYQKLDNFDPSRHSLQNYLSHLRPEDKWILARINDVVAKTSAYLNEMEIHKAVKEILSFVIDDLSRTYLRSVRRIAWSEAETPEKFAAYSCLYYVLKKTLLVLAPFAPYITEYLYQTIRTSSDKETIHLESWPEVDQMFYDRKLIAQMELVRDVLTSILAARQKGGRKLRSPVTRIILVPKTSEAHEALKVFSSFLMESSNAENIEIRPLGSVFEEASWKVEGDLAQLGPVLGRRLPQLLNYLKNSDGALLKKEIETKNGLTVPIDDGERFLPSTMFNVIRVVPEFYSYAENPNAEIYVDMRMSEELEATSSAKEVIRRIQVMRKEADLNILEKIECIIQTDDESFKKHVEVKKGYIESETRAIVRTAKLGDPVPDGFFVRSWDIDGVAVRIGFRRTANNIYNFPGSD